MADLISREAAMDILHECGGDEMYPPNMVKMRGKMYELPAVDAVSRGLYEQIKWERDVAIDQLAELGIGYGAKVPDMVEVVRCKDCEREQTCRIAQRLGIFGYCSEGERREENAADKC